MNRSSATRNIYSALKAIGLVGQTGAAANA